MLECVVNISEGRRQAVVSTIADAAGDRLLDLHHDPHHNRSVLTLVGEGAARAVARAAVGHIDLRLHEGVHPRLGAIDVVPFVPLAGSELADALRARDDFAAWAAEELGLPCFLYGPERSLPDLRREVLTSWHPDVGPTQPHPTAGGCAVGARMPLVAYNLWLADADLEKARRLAASIRGPRVRALGLQVGSHVQVSMNLIEPELTGPAAVYDLLSRSAAIDRAELVGLLPLSVLGRIPPARWETLDLAPDRTIEARLEAAGISPR